jgi:small nuclear ribonucleoprotein (snRNP)-like protein|tara:strand:+ start:81 stop:392 length:312 start_codon:yes stop_codon:yes gene_type:complete
VLIETNYKVNDVVTIKLKSGEELVGRLEEENEHMVKVSTPLTIVATEKGIGLQQFLFTADVDKSYTIKHEAITLLTITNENFADAYRKQTSSLVVPDKPSLIV